MLFDLNVTFSGIDISLDLCQLPNIAWGYVLLHPPSDKMQWQVSVPMLNALESMLSSVGHLVTDARINGVDSSGLSYIGKYCANLRQLIAICSTTLAPLMPMLEVPRY